MTIFLKLMSDTKPKIQEAQRTLKRIRGKIITPMNIIFKLQKEKKEKERK